MIVLNLSCRDGHQFEGWFASRDAFDEQMKRGQVNCSLCNSPDVAALPSGPLILRGQSQPPKRSASAISGNSDLVHRLFRTLLDAARGAEDVGERFAEEARRIHYQEAPARTIRGLASIAETEDLLEEGIVVLPVPVAPDRETH